MGRSFAPFDINMPSRQPSETSYQNMLTGVLLMNISTIPEHLAARKSCSLRYIMKFYTYL